MRAAVIVLGQSPLVLHVVELFLVLTADVAEGHLGFLPPLLHQLHQLLPALLRESRHLDTDHVPIVLGVQAQVRRSDGLLHGPDLGAVEGPDHQEIRVRGGDVGDVLGGVGVP